MKKIAFTLAAFFAISAGIAQDLTSKKGMTILPVAGDIGLGFDALPMLRYAGTFGTGGNVSPSADFTFGNQAIFFKYFLEDNMAVRGTVRLGFGSSSKTNFVQSDAAFFVDGNSTPSKKDELKISYNAITLGGGIEKRRGEARVQGYYGGELLFSIGGGKNTYSYGNPFSNDYTATNTVDFDLGISAQSNTRIKEMKQGSTLGVTARGLVGVEYFFAPKISVGAEYGWGLGFSNTGEGSSKTEWWGLANANATDSSVNTTTIKTGGRSMFGIDTDNSGGSIRLLFHF